MSEIMFYHALLAGVLSFVSPCVLPLIPAYGVLLICLSETKAGQTKVLNRIAFISTGFLFGFLLIFISTSTPSFLGNIVFEYQKYLRMAGGILLIIIGLTVSLAGWLPSLNLHRWKSLLIAANVDYPVAIVAGLGVGSGWTPCIGPKLGVILLKASSQGTSAWGATMLVFYSMGLAIPFILTALMVHFLLRRVGEHKFASSVISIFSGIAIIVVGYNLLRDDFRQLTTLFPDVVSY